MKVKTKYEIGDYVWVNYDGKIKNFVIKGIDIKVRTLIVITYELKPNNSPYLLTYKENEIFETESKLKKAMGL